MAWSVLQSASGTGTSSATATFGSNASSGTKIIAFCACDLTESFTVADAAANAWTSMGAITGGSGSNKVGVQLFALDTPAGDVGIKPAIKATASGGSPNVGIVVMEVSGLLAGNTTAMLDGTAATVAETPVSPQSQPAYTSHASNEFLVSCLGDNGNSVTYALSGYTPDSSNINGSANTDVLIYYKNSTNGAESGSWTTSGTPTMSGLIVVAFKLAAGGVTPAPFYPSPHPAQARIPQARPGLLYIN
jgi:hypothetical protein